LSLEHDHFNVFVRDDLSEFADAPEIALRARGQAPGLDNIGVTCFVNAILEQLFRVEELRQFLFDYRGVERFTYKLGNLFWRITACSDPFETNIQQDASEFVI
jgi:ubiquitin C-terminal hydrolase